jgi:hypothetical protein
VASELLCPSAQPEIAGAVAIGLVDHEQSPPSVSYLDKPAQITPELLELAQPLRPTELFRFAAPCQGERCSHWSGSDCNLIGGIVKLLPDGQAALPACGIRPDCRWFAQSGTAACLRCPEVITQNQDPSEAMRIAAAPAARP